MVTSSNQTNLSSVDLLADRASKWPRSSENPAFPFIIHDLRRTILTIAESFDIPAYAVKPIRE
jgi:hypothetical protein